MELNLKNIVLFFISCCVIILFIVLLVNGKKDNINYDNVKASKNNYQIYDVDSLVKLKDDSEWFVLKNTSKNDKNIVLISKNKINNEPITDVKNYIGDNYLDSLCNSLYISRDEISEVRLLSSSDICDLYESDCSDFDTKFDTSKYKLLESATIVDYYSDTKLLNLCSEGFCDNNNTDIRVVISIPKFFIKEEKED